MSRIYRVVLWLCVLGIAGMIFCFSAQDGDVSSNTSGEIVEKVIEVVDEAYQTRPPVEQQSIFTFVERLVRKGAHFLEYAALGFFLRLLAQSHGWHRPTRLSLLAGALYACTDELHQLFISQRTAQLQDVLLDSAGVLTGICVARMLIYLQKRWKERKA